MPTEKEINDLFKIDVFSMGQIIFYDLLDFDLGFREIQGKKIDETES